MGRRLCECGCGRAAPIAKATNTTRGRVRGRAFRCIQGHHQRGRNGARSNSWQGGRYITQAGYVQVYGPGHPNANGRGYVAEHILIASQSIGGQVPRGAEVHHVNGVRADNQPGNLVICENHAYHHLLHRRANALRACGHAGWTRCWVCGRWDAPENVYTKPRGTTSCHTECIRRYNARLRKTKKGGTA